MSKNAYQFKLKQPLPIGYFVAINGEHDKFGKVYGHTMDEKENNHIVHLIRGIGDTLPAGVAAWPLQKR